MIQASDFIDRIGAHGYDFFAAGPCASFTPLVDTVIDAPGSIISRSPTRATRSRRPPATRWPAAAPWR